MIHGKETKALVFFCPRCGSAAVEPKTTLELVPTHYGCSICRWEGTREEVVATEFSHDLGSQHEIKTALVNDLRKVLAREGGAAFGGFLMKWGFTSNPIQPLELARYLQAISEATLKAIILEREKIEKEGIGERGN